MTSPKLSSANELQCELLLYLDIRRYLADMRDHCEDFLEQLTEKTLSKFPPLRFLFEIDVMDLLDVSPELGEFFIAEPNKFKRMCNDILFACVQATDIETRNNIEYDQVAVILRLKSVPIDSNSRYHKGLVTIDGLLLSVSKPETYVLHSVWSCPEECDGNEVILHYIPKHPPKCHLCKSNLFENSGLRQCGEQVTATFKIRNQLLPKTLKITDDLISKLNLGTRYIIHAVVTKKITTILSMENVITLAAPLTNPIPKDVDDLFKACKETPWKFIYCLASSIGVNVCPLHCFMHLKINLLLSLTSVKANAVSGANILHVLVGGFDTRYVGEIMADAAKLADRSVILGASNSVAQTALIASSGGVCVMPLPLHIYSHKQISAILAAIETGDMNTGTALAKLNAAVWAQGMDFKKMILYNVASVFGNVCRGDCGEFYDEINEFVLQRAVEPVGICKEEIKALKDVATYIDVVAGIEVVIDDMTKKLLQNYFLAARKENTKIVCVGSMNALVTICLTSARLCRRRVTNIDDAVFAIWLHVCGSPEPRFAPEDYLQTPADVRKLQKVITSFKHWLEEFTGSCLL
ncbi:unnamed protein product [Spodoptera littoralis]|uniref:MCMDC2 N-terminal domain-containing protein n=1 Tax=Spodoptera littoralis TaxID=7109 RepID=A0A9P0HZU6_SPOLI|nr:unnamed protein product [Spodoptera littoralis]CAH1637030.1 unnamed protein product [Spodoptera littoralis]